MSRSYKKHKIFKIAGDKSYKKIFNRRLRRIYKNNPEDFPQHYKRANCSWDIADYIFSAEWKDFQNWYWPQELSDEEKWAEWKRQYGSK